MGPLLPFFSYRLLITASRRTGTILRRKGNGMDQEYGKRKVKTRTLENHEDAAPKFVQTLQGCATRHPNSS